jgi:transposase
MASSADNRPGGTESGELARLRAENKKLKADSAKLEARNEKLAGELGKTKTALDIAGKAFALLEDIPDSADSGES